MRVALDGRPLQSSSAARGIGRYVRELARCLPGAPGVEEVFLALDARRAVPDDLGSVPGVRLLPLARPRGPATLLDRVREAREIGERGIDVFHATYLPPPRVAASVATVMTVHDLIPLQIAGSVPLAAGLVFRFAFAAAPACHRVVAVSRATAKAVTDHLGVPAERIVVTPLGVDAARFRPPPEGAGPLFPGRYLLHVGGFDPAKNLGLLLEVMERLASDAACRDLRLVVAGGGGDRARAFEAQAAARGLGERVLLAGRLSDTDLARAYAGATLFVFPSRAEGFGLSPLEAQAAGCPVLAADAASLPEVVGDAGWLLPPDDPAAWSEAVRELVARPDERHALGEAGRRRAATHTWEATAEATARAYREAREIG